MGGRSDLLARNPASRPRVDATSRRQGGTDLGGTHVSSTALPHRAGRGVRHRDSPSGWRQRSGCRPPPRRAGLAPAASCSARRPPGSTTSTCAAPSPRPRPSSARPARSGSAVEVRWNSLGTPATISPITGTLGAASGDAGRRRPRLADSRTPPCSGSRPPRSTPSRWSTTRSSPTPPPARCCSARSSAPCPRGRQHRHGRRRRRRGPVRLLLARPRATAASAPAPTLTPTAAWLKAAANVGRDVRARHDLRGRRPRRLDPLQGRRPSPRSRWSACAPSRTQTAPCARSSRPTSIDVEGRQPPRRTRVLVDAVTGKVLVRQNKVDQS